MRISPVIRISLGLVSLTVSLLLLGKMIGFAPDQTKAVLDSRKSFVEALAVQFSAAAQRNDISLIRATLQHMVNSTDEINSAAVRAASGELLAEAGQHLIHWQSPEGGKSTPTHIQIPIYKGQDLWANVELNFKPLWIENINSGFKNSYLSLILFVGFAGFAGYFLFMKRTLRELDPSAVVPGRVQSAFDVLKEGVLILDEKELIVLANKSLAEVLGKTTNELIGFKGSELGWKDFAVNRDREKLPWMRVINGENSLFGIRMVLERKNHQPVVFRVNVAPVLDGSGKRRGVLVTCDDITELEEKNLELNRTVNKLQLTTEEVQQKNKELEFLASHDPLTQLLNRRAFNQQFDVVFNKSKLLGQELSCIMCDIDHFKSVNDRYGHYTGDKVIKMVAKLLSDNSRESDLVGRYGGEEFCVVLPGLSIEKAAQLANRFRLAIKEDASTGISVTMSFGVSSLLYNANEPGELSNQADKALYIAKESGRNSVVCWGDEEVAGFATLEQKKDGEQQENGAEERSQKDSLEVDSIEVGDHQHAVEEVKRLTVRLQEIEAIAEKKTQELHHFTAYDALTGLPTRTLFYDRVIQALVRGRRYNNIVAMLSMSVGTIKRISETLGHKSGEKLYKEIANRVSSILRTMDTVAKLPASSPSPTISRLGEDDFGILLTDIEEVNAITWIVKRILSSFEQTFTVDGHEIHATANIGISIYPYDGHSAEELETHATAARSYAKKELGVNRYYFYSDNINAISIKHLQIEGNLYRAVTNNEFVLYYQPKIDAQSGAISGMEALIRWNDPDVGLISPHEFIPVAEYSGLIGTIGEWVLLTACQQIRKWLDLGFTECTVAVNFSNKQFHQKDLAKSIEMILAKNRLNPSHLVVEVTENSMMENINRSMQILQEIKELGVVIALDDFGTGYSSLGYLKNFPVDYVKIDRSFVADIETNRKDATLVKSIISMAHSMDLRVTAEGVENREQLSLLRQYECDEMQGFLFSKPVPEEEATSLLQNGILHALQQWPEEEVVELVN